MPLAEPLVLPRADAMPGEPTPLRCERFHSSPQVLSARAGDTVVLMDQRRGTYYTLNEVGGRVWELAGAGATVSEVVERLLDEYDVPQPQLERDVIATLRQLVGDRLLAAGVASTLPQVVQMPDPISDTAAETSGLRVPSVLKCSLMIFAVKVMLRTKGFGWTLDWLEGRVEQMPVRNGVNLEFVKATEYQVALAGALYPGRALCLEQSLVLYSVLRGLGIGAQLALGVQARPFVAHAWVECNSQLINDVPEHVNRFARLLGRMS